MVQSGYQVMTVVFIKKTVEIHPRSIHRGLEKAREQRPARNRLSYRLKIAITGVFFFHITTLAFELLSGVIDFSLLVFKVIFLLYFIVVRSQSEFIN